MNEQRIFDRVVGLLVGLLLGYLCFTLAHAAAGTL
jgi:uncharacterized membrane protein YgaE (UPF0421/DUF939 family)